ncbi:Stk1 family PASTA domain-containing Ser/Thr kinase [Blastococcus sp. CT_GayMR20]|uniref:Stk1 family PASTA domain-containing Ser/Thr kinase n=1 Tax=Blastococcus sp. CT_GayMR20 TaxID=2559609 RepID=UPI0010744E65|nr:Stk1 family PASTA domain-containing Ser/Thr kinase [Blastococcus sp. CT_GayMR20]TFV92588.1 Stk1 family PASTA domain-containing Ser/Thr kinase [Blastococcus sp. CT_GayMR20]TFV92625.1 Stk1 family PASTA domain-containing Ser/Thr kinase [Blastococcus sp. CT_GayMR20]
MTTPQVLGERYEIGGVLGRGGMAEVHRGRDLRLGREVAVKVLRHDLARDPSFQVRFRREAQASASLNHPAIVAVYDTGEDRTTTGATPYIVMEYVEGETLRDVLRREGHLTPERAMALSADICGALDFSHRNGIVHRDVKPGNVMITPQGTVKVMDFGIARAVSDSAATMTSTAAVIGTAQYLSPEQARGEGVDARSDVYSMGCMLFELVTGAPPFTGDSPVAVAYQHVREDPRLPSSINPAIPPELDAIVLKAMSKNPANRYQSAAEMRNDLLRALAGQRVEATPVMGDAEKTTILSATPGVPYRDDDWDDADEADRRRRRKIIAIVAVVVALLVAGAVALAIAMSGDDETPPAAQVAVPGLVDLTEAEARQRITDAGLVVGEVTTRPVTDTTQVGTVLESDPAGGAQVEEGTEVSLVVGAEPDAVAIPGVVGLDVEQAQSNLAADGFNRVTIDRVDSAAPEGEVISVDPEEGTQVPVDTAITLEVSDGDVAVPDVRGEDQATATQTLRSAGFTNITSAEVDSQEPAGTVLGTSPAAGTQATADTAITLQISGGPAEPTSGTVPNVRGQSEAGAQALLAQAGFTNVDFVESDEVDPTVGPGQVQATDPAGGSTQPFDTEITVILNPGG